MRYIGCHLSSSAGLCRAWDETALSIGANTFQFFTRNPRGSQAKPVDPADAAALSGAGYGGGTGGHSGPRPLYHQPLLQG